MEPCAVAAAVAEPDGFPVVKDATQLHVPVQTAQYVAVGLNNMQTWLTNIADACWFCTDSPSSQLDEPNAAEEDPGCLKLRRYLYILRE